MYPIFERVSTDKLFKSEIGIIKRTLKELIRDGKIVLIDSVYNGSMKYYDISFMTYAPIEYTGDIATYVDKDYCMIGVNLSKFRVDIKKLPTSVLEDLTSEVRHILKQTVGFRYDSSFVRDDYPIIWECIESLGFANKPSFSDKEIEDIIRYLITHYKPSFDNLESLNNLSLSWQRGINGLNIKDKDFMPIFIFDPSNYKLYYFDPDLFTVNMYYKTVEDLIKKKMLKEIDIDKISSLRSMGRDDIGSPQGCLVKGFS